VLKVQGSCGKGNWATIPWISILNKKITQTTQEGVYIVYLFSEDMKRIYLTLNQGYTKLKQKHGKKEVIEIMQNNAVSIRESIASNGFNTEFSMFRRNEFGEG